MLVINDLDVKTIQIESEMGQQVKMTQATMWRQNKRVRKISRMTQKM